VHEGSFGSLKHDARAVGNIDTEGNEDDVSAVLECLREAFEPYRDSYTEGAFLDTVPPPEAVRKRLAAMCVFVATTPSGEVAGTVACNVVSPEEGHIRGMAVRTAWHGTGVATELIRSVEMELRERKCSRISLDTTVPLQRAMRFYEKNGFRKSGRITDFFGMQLIEYVKDLRG
jgi:ribosomal protein S18 acetylase RimI-like enzyme